MGRGVGRPPPPPGSVSHRLHRGPSPTSLRLCRVLVRGAPDDTEDEDIEALFAPLGLQPEGVEARDAETPGEEAGVYAELLGIVPEVEWVVTFATPEEASEALRANDAVLGTVAVKVGRACVRSVAARRLSATILLLRTKGRPTPRPTSEKCASLKIEFVHLN